MGYSKLEEIENLSEGFYFIDLKSNPTDRYILEFLNVDLKTKVIKYRYVATLHDHLWDLSQGRVFTHDFEVFESIYKISNIDIRVPTIEDWNIGWKLFFNSAQEYFDLVVKNPLCDPSKFFSYKSYFGEICVVKPIALKANNVYLEIHSKSENQTLNIGDVFVLPVISKLGVTGLEDKLFECDLSTLQNFFTKEQLSENVLKYFSGSFVSQSILSSALCFLAVSYISKNISKTRFFPKTKNLLL